MLQDDIDIALAEEELIGHKEYLREIVSIEESAKLEFESIVFKKCRFIGCDFSQSTFRLSKIEEGVFHYANFEEVLWDKCEFENCDLSESFLAEVRFQKTVFSKVNFAKADFFKTMLDGIDLSDCNIEGIMISDSFRELRGLKISPLQAMDLVRFLGVAIV